MTPARRPVSALALAGLVGPLFFTTLVVVQGLLLPDYSHIKLPISALAAWPTGWIQVLNFLVTGSLMVAFAMGLNLGVLPSRQGIAGTALLALGGIGIIIAGIFSWKMVDGVPTATAPHVVGAITAFGGTGAGLVVFARRMRADGAWADLAGYTMFTGVIVVCLFFAIGFFAVDDGTPLHPWAGLLQRVLCAMWFTCLIVLALRLRRVSTQRAAG